MNVAKVQSLVSVVGYHEGEVEEYQRKVARIKAELTKVESALVGAKESLRNARFILAKASAALPLREVTNRERDIAHMVGEHLVVGEALSQEVWSNICAKRSS